MSPHPWWCGIPPCGGGRLFFSESALASPADDCRGIRKRTCYLEALRDALRPPPGLLRSIARSNPPLLLRWGIRGNSPPTRGDQKKSIWPPPPLAMRSYCIEGKTIVLGVLSFRSSPSTCFISYPLPWRGPPPSPCVEHRGGVLLKKFFLPPPLLSPPLGGD